VSYEKPADLNGPYKNIILRGVFGPNRRLEKTTG
jgi:hypothetical protein